MAQAQRFVHIVDEVSELSTLDAGPVLVHALQGFIDAGNAATLATSPLLGQAPAGS